MPKAPDIAAFMAALDHPHKHDIEQVRQIIVTASGDITDGVKWNAPSFFCKDWFATVNLRAREGVQIILHRGAKSREDMTAVDDPHLQLKWLDGNRAIVTFASADDIATRRDAFATLIRAWILQM